MEDKFKIIPIEGKTKRFEDPTGKKFNRLFVLGLSASSHNGRYLWVCRCDCGNLTVASTYHLMHGRKKSCGCLHEEKLKNGQCHHIHGGYHKGKTSRLLECYKNMIRRCYEPTNAKYKNYGARGIVVCDEWRESFTNFKRWAEENGYDDSLTIDRIDVNKNYCPENCRWTNIYTQNRNRTTNINITIGDETKCILDWCRDFNLPEKTVYQRYARGDRNPERLFRPVRKIKKTPR